MASKISELVPKPSGILAGRWTPQLESGPLTFASKLEFDPGRPTVISEDGSEVSIQVGAAFSSTGIFSVGATQDGVRYSVDLSELPIESGLYIGFTNGAGVPGVDFNQLAAFAISRGSEGDLYYAMLNVFSEDEVAFDPLPEGMDGLLDLVISVDYVESVQTVRVYSSDDESGEPILTGTITTPVVGINTFAVYGSLGSGAISVEILPDTEDYYPGVTLLQGTGSNVIVPDGFANSVREITGLSEPLAHSAGILSNGKAAVFNNENTLVEILGDDSTRFVEGTWVPEVPTHPALSSVDAWNLSSSSTSEHLTVTAGSSAGWVVSDGEDVSLDFTGVRGIPFAFQNLVDGASLTLGLTTEGAGDASPDVLCGITIIRSGTDFTASLFCGEDSTSALIAAGNDSLEEVFSWQVRRSDSDIKIEFWVPYSLEEEHLSLEVSPALFEDMLYSTIVVSADTSDLEVRTFFAPVEEYVADILGYQSGTPEYPPACANKAYYIQKSSSFELPVVGRVVGGDILVFGETEPNMAVASKQMVQGITGRVGIRKWYADTVEEVVDTFTEALGLSAELQDEGQTVSITTLTPDPTYFSPTVAIAKTKDLSLTTLLSTVGEAKGLFFNLPDISALVGEGGSYPGEATLSLEIRITTEAVAPAVGSFRAYVLLHGDGFNDSDIWGPGNSYLSSKVDMTGEATGIGSTNVNTGVSESSIDLNTDDRYYFGLRQEEGGEVVAVFRNISTGQQAVTASIDALAYTPDAVHAEVRIGFGGAYAVAGAFAFSIEGSPEGNSLEDYGYLSFSTFTASIDTLPQDRANNTFEVAGLPYPVQTPFGIAYNRTKAVFDSYGELCGLIGAVTPPNFYNKTEAPGPTDDVSTGALPGSKWYATIDDSPEIYLCGSNAVGEAAWVHVTYDASEMGTASLVDVGSNADQVRLNEDAETWVQDWVSENYIATVEGFSLTSFGARFHYENEEIAPASWSYRRLFGTTSDATEVPSAFDTGMYQLFDDGMAGVALVAHYSGEIDPNGSIALQGFFLYFVHATSDRHALLRVATTTLDTATTVSAGKSFTLGKSPAAPLEAATKAFVEGMLTTGVLFGGEISINGLDNATFDISAGSGIIVDHTVYPPAITNVTWDAFEGVELDNLLTAYATDVAIDENGDLVQQSSFSLEELRSVILLGGVDHSNQTNISDVFSIQVPADMAPASVRDLAAAIGDINLRGNVISPNGANLYIDKSSGDVFAFGKNLLNDRNSPHNLSVASQSAATFRRVYDNGSGVAAFSAATQAIDPNKYDDGSGTLEDVANNYWTLQKVSMFANTGNVIVQYGVAEFNKKAEAIAAFGLAQFPELSGITTAIPLGYLIVKQGATDLSDENQAVFIQAGNGRTVSGGVSTPSWEDILFAIRSAEVVHLTTHHTLTVDDLGKTLVFTSATDVDLTIDNSPGFPENFRFDVIQAGAGAVFFEGTCTLNNRHGHLQTSGQFAAVSFIAYAANTFLFQGDTA
jgi:hypothetical protein